MKFNYSLNYNDYSVRNALLWGNCSKHFQKAGEGRLGSQIIHVLIGIAELIPVIGQISSIFEMIIVTQFGDRPHVFTSRVIPAATQGPLVIASVDNATSPKSIPCTIPTLVTELPPIVDRPHVITSPVNSTSIQGPQVIASASNPTSPKSIPCTIPTLVTELPPIVGPSPVFTSPVISTSIQGPRVIVSAGNATALEFISCINENLFVGLTRLTEQEVQDFLDLGGALNIVSEDKQRITIHSLEQVITGCNSGINRSQVAAAIVQQMKIGVIGVLAGGDSAMNPEADYHNFADPKPEADYHNFADPKPKDDTCQSASNFKAAFGFDKIKQVGAEKYPGPLQGREKVNKAKQFYQDYINKLNNPYGTHFITFGPSGPSVLRRLLQKPGGLRGFTITHIPWGDEIAHPPEGFVRYSTESYKRFGEKLQACFVVSP